MRAAKPKVVNSIAGFQAAAEAVTHKGGEIVAVFGSFRTAAAEELAIQAGITAGVAGDHSRIEIGDPFPNQAMQIVHAEDVRLLLANQRQIGRRWC